MDRLKNVVKSLVPSRHINKVTKDELKAVKKELDKEENNKLIETINDVLKSEKYTKKLNNKIKELVDNNEDEISNEQVCEIVEEIIKEIDDENLEEELDKECERYIKFTESNPAENIKYNKNKNKNNYILIQDKKEISSRKLSKLVNIKKEKIVHYLCDGREKIVSQKKNEIWRQKNNIKFL
jgi:hypothetical protein